MTAELNYDAIAAEYVNMVNEGKIEEAEAYLKQFFEEDTDSFKKFIGHVDKAVLDLRAKKELEASETVAKNVEAVTSKA